MGNTVANSDRRWLLVEPVAAIAVKKHDRFAINDSRSQKTRVPAAALQRISRMAFIWKTTSANSYRWWLLVEPVVVVAAKKHDRFAINNSQRQNTGFSSDASAQ
jgi:hypothetical protein